MKRLMDDAHPGIAEVLDLALDAFGINHFTDNGWYGADLIGDGGHVVRLAAEGNDPDEGIAVHVFDTNWRAGVLRYSVRFDGAPLAVIVATIAEAIK